MSNVVLTHWRFIMFASNSVLSPFRHSTTNINGIFMWNVIFDYVTEVTLIPTKCFYYLIFLDDHLMQHQQRSFQAHRSSMINSYFFSVMNCSKIDYVLWLNYWCLFITICIILTTELHHCTPKFACIYSMHMRSGNFIITLLISRLNINSWSLLRNINSWSLLRINESISKWLCCVVWWLKSESSLHTLSSSLDHSCSRTGEKSGARQWTRDKRYSHFPFEFI